MQLVLTVHSSFKSTKTTPVIVQKVQRQLGQGDVCWQIDGSIFPGQSSLLHCCSPVGFARFSVVVNTNVPFDLVLTCECQKSWLIGQLLQMNTSWNMDNAILYNTYFSLSLKEKHLVRGLGVGFTT